MLTQTMIQNIEQMAAENMRIYHPTAEETLLQAIFAFNTNPDGLTEDDRVEFVAAFLRGSVPVLSAYAHELLIDIADNGLPTTLTPYLTDEAADAFNELVQHGMIAERHEVYTLTDLGIKAL